MPRKSVVLPKTKRYSVKRGNKHFLYWYMRAGGPAFWVTSGATLAECEANEQAAAEEIAAAYLERKSATPEKGRVAWLINRYINSADYQKTRPSTKRVWQPHLSAIGAEFGTDTFRMTQAKGYRAKIRQHRDTLADRPRTADMRMQVLRRVFSWAVDNEYLDRNPATAMGKLDDARRAEQIWEPNEIAAFLGSDATAATKRAFRFLSLTGLRPGDAIQIRWNEIKGNRIIRPTNKSRGKQSAVIDIDDALQALLNETPRDAVTILTNEKGQPWASVASLSNAIQSTAKELGIKKRTYDLRGTAITHLVNTGKSPLQIAFSIGWSASEVERIIMTYCDPENVRQGNG